MKKLLQTIPFLLLGTSLVGLPPQKSAALTVQEAPRVAMVSTKLPVVKSAGLKPDIHVPWSKPVRVKDPFEGNFIGVFDRNSLGGYLYREGAKQVISLWTRESVRVLVTVNSGEYGFYNPGSLYSSSYYFYPGFYPSSYYLESGDFFYPTPDYGACLTTRRVVKLFVKVREQVFQLVGSNGTFVVTDKLANALKNAPVKNVDIRLVLDGGSTVDSQIGKGTVKAWRTIY
jgi:hypothetical protein